MNSLDEIKQNSIDKIIKYSTESSVARDCGEVFFN